MGPLHYWLVFGTFVAYVPAISDCHAWGQTPEEAQTERINVFEMIEEEYKEEGCMLPSMRQKGSHARWKHSDGRATTISWKLLSIYAKIIYTNNA